MYDAGLDAEVLVKLFKVLSKPDALEIFILAGEGIENSTYAMEELGFTSKRYYARLRELVDMGFLRKTEGVYRQTPFGSIIYSRLIPAIGRAYDSRDRLSLISEFKGTDIENDVRNLLEDELNIPDLGSNKVKILETYEEIAIEVTDLYDSAKESVLLASNYFDVRCMEACFRSTERGVTNRIIMGKKSLESKLQNLRMMLSLTFAKTVINFTSNKVKMREFLKFVDLPYSFCVVDGHRNIIEFFNPLNEIFIFALSIDDRIIGERLTTLYEMIWESGDYQPTAETMNTFKPN